MKSVNPGSLTTNAVQKKLVNVEICGEELIITLLIIKGDHLNFFPILYATLHLFYLLPERKEEKWHVWERNV